MKAYVAGESPKTMMLETADDKQSWRAVSSLTAECAWGESVSSRGNGEGGRKKESAPA